MGPDGPTSLSASLFSVFLSFFLLLLFCVGRFRVGCGPEGPTSLNLSPRVGLFDFYLWRVLEVR